MSTLPVGRLGVGVRLGGLRQGDLVRHGEPGRLAVAGGPGARFDTLSNKVETDTNILDLRTRYRTKLGCIFWF